MNIAEQLAEALAGKGAKFPAQAKAERLLAVVLGHLSLREAEMRLLHISPSSMHILVRHEDAPQKRLNPGGAQFVLKIMVPHEAADIEIPASLAHPHLLPLLVSDSVKNDTEKIFYCASPYYPGLTPLHEAVRKRLDTGSASSRDAGEILLWLGRRLREIAGAISFLHENNFLHMDIKPENMMLDQDGNALLIDTASARQPAASGRGAKGQSGGKVPAVLAGESDTCCAVLTKCYAHPELRLLLNDAGAQGKPSLRLPRSRLHTRFDIYAFGRSILALLAEINSRFPGSMPYDYTFSWLHLAACRMLDGQNQEESTQSLQYSEIWPGLGREELRALAYPSMARAADDFDKLFAETHYLSEIPEFSASTSRRIFIAEGEPAPLSERVRRVIEHPVFARLAAVPQIELLSSIFPTATHTRYEHSLGAFRNAVRYIRGLWEDAYNPLFRQLVERKQIELLLLAVLVHDLGQYPFGHTVEELGEEFRHENLSRAFLDNPTRDSRGNTLREIIESPGFGWGLEADDLKRFLSLPRRGGGGTDDFFSTRNLVEEMLHSILDGPIDADKLDYLVRDSHMCFLSYGSAIDSERLIANLTIIIHSDENGRRRLSLGAYERGEPAAESLSFARYLLYQTLYWHHASRAGRSMFLAAIKPLAAKSAPRPLRGGRKTHASGSASLMASIAKFLTANDEVRTVTLADVLDFFEKRVDANGRELIQRIRSRRYYKRLCTIHEEKSVPSPAETGGGAQARAVREKSLQGAGGSAHGEARSHISLKDFRAAVSAGEGGEMGERLRVILRKRFEALLTAQELPGNSLLTPEKGERALSLLAEPNAILCDAPRPSIGADNNLFFVPAPQRLAKNLNQRHASGERVSAVWNRVHEELMSIAAKGRVFCHPDIRDPLMALLSPADIENCILEAMKKKS